MESLLFTGLFALVAAYGALCVSDPALSLRLDRTAKRTDPDRAATAIRNRRYAGWIAIGVAVFGSVSLVGFTALVISVATALATLVATSMR